MELCVDLGGLVTVCPWVRAPGHGRVRRKGAIPTTEAPLRIGAGAWNLRIRTFRAQSVFHKRLSICGRLSTEFDESKALERQITRQHERFLTNRTWAARPFRN